MNNKILVRVVFTIVLVAVMSATVGCRALVISADDYDSKFDSNFGKDPVGIPRE